MAGLRKDVELKTPWIAELQNYCEILKLVAKQRCDEIANAIESQKRSATGNVEHFNEAVVGTCR